MNPAIAQGDLVKTTVKATGKVVTVPKAQHQHGVIRTTKRFEVADQAFGYCENSEVHNGTCYLVKRFVPGKKPLNLFMSLEVDNSFIGLDTDLTMFIEAAETSSLIWEATVRGKIEFASQLSWITYGGSAEGSAPYPSELVSLAKGRYLYIASVITLDGANYAERSQPFVIR